MYDYSNKLITLEKAQALLKDGDTVMAGSLGEESYYFMSNLHLILDKIGKIRLLTINTPYQYEYFKPEYKNNLEINPWFYSGWH